MLFGNRGLRLIVCVLAGLLLSGCASRVNLWPVYFRESTAPAGQETQGRTVTEVAWPFFHSETTPQNHWHALRPLYNYETDRTSGDWRVQYLWPLGWRARKGNTSHSRFFPVYSRKTIHPEAADKASTHGFVFPFVCFGNDDTMGPYFAVFPLGGVTHEVLGRTWWWVLFPLLSHYEREGYTRWDYPWPFLGHGASPDGKQKHRRFWPFYVRQEYEDGWVKRSTTDLLWPLVRWGRLERRGSSRYYKMFKVAFFYSAIRTYDRSSDELLARRARFLGFGRWREDTPEGGWEALWGLLRHRETDKKTETRFFPFYIHKRYYRSAERTPETSRSLAVAPWPVVWRDVNRLHPTHHQFITVVAPVYWHYTDRYFDAGTPAGPAPGTRTRRTLLPLTTWGKDRDGTAHLWVPSHGWDDQTKGFKRNYRAFFEIFQYHGRPAGGSEMRILWRLYHQRTGPGGNYVSAGPLFTYDNEGALSDGDRYFECLFGLIKRSWGHESGWRLFYVPFGSH